MQRAFAAALIVEEERLPIAQHDIAGLEIAIEKVIALCAQQKLCQAAKISLQRLLIKWHAGEPQKIILEIVQVPGDGLAIEAGARIADLVIQIAARLDLKTRQRGNDFSIGFNRRRRDGFAVSICAKKLKERGVAQVFFKVSALAQIFCVNLRHRQSTAVKML